MSAVAPNAPGQLGEAIDPRLLLEYLTELGAWIGSRRAELDELDAAVRASAHVAELTADIRLGLTLWQAIKTRYDQMLITWDNGRVGQTEREKLSQLIWSRIEAPGAGGTGLSVPDAGRLSDALTGQLRERLHLDPDGSQVTLRIKSLRAQVERLRDQVALEPATSLDAAHRQLSGLAARVEDVSAKAGRGGDVGGLLGPLEAAAATFERDLIVGGAQRRQTAGRVELITRQRDALASREPALTELAARAVAAVTPAPKYAVPDVERLGPVPSAPAELDAYAARLDQVAAAMDFVEAAYGRALTEVAELRADLAAVAVTMTTNDVGLAAMMAAARGVLDESPVHLDAARTLIAAVRAYTPKGVGR